MTSNLGSEILLDNVKEDGVISPETKEQVMKLAQAHFKPEFLNRIDDIITFSPLTFDAIEKIVDKFIGQLSARLSSQEIELKINDDARKWIAKEGYDPAYGAPAIATLHYDSRGNAIAKEIIAGKVMPHSVVTIGLGANDNLVFKAEDDQAE